MNIQQGTDQWLAWRKEGIGASESAVILGVSEDSTPYKLWLEKTGQGKQDDWANRTIFARGHEVEAKIRASYEFDNGATFSPATLEHKAPYQFIRASLDGWCEEKRKGIEIKLVGAEAFEALRIPQKHIIQMQHQMMVTEIETWDYVMSVDGSGFKVIPVQADKEIQGEILNKCSWFWGLVQSKTPAPYCVRDWIPSDDPELVKVLGFLKDCKDEKGKEAKFRQDNYRDQIFRLVKHPRTLCGDIKVMRTEKRKSISFGGEE